MQHPWKHSVIDVYANNNGNVVQDFLSLVVEPSFQALERKREELTLHPDPCVVAFAMMDHLGLEQKTAMAFCLGIQSLWEQQIRSYMVGCMREFFKPHMPEDQVAEKIELAERVPWGSRFSALFLEARGLELKSFPSYTQLELLMTLGNVCRHGEGDAARKLRKSHPELWPTSLPLLEEHFGNRPVSDLRLSFELLRSLVHAVVLFWRELERHGLKSFMHDQSDDEIEARLSNHIRV
ncbi:hypothetical protein ACSFE6_04840 [Pseudomonas baetica]|uniref:hypothetical protein n=1 Tax=Pseudomonas baetica TaxID=674054 RepID=UPI003EECB0C7